MLPEVSNLLIFESYISSEIWNEKLQHTKQTEVQSEHHGMEWSWGPLWDRQVSRSGEAPFEVLVMSKENIGWVV